METSKKLTRSASHAGSWYDSDPSTLIASIKSWLTAKPLSNIKLLKGIIGPHAGYVYSASTAGYAYTNIIANKYNKVVLLGPSHKKYLTGCGLPSCTIYETPLGNINVDTEEVNKLSKLKDFIILTKKEEEAEHSLEMHLPFIKYAFGEQPFSLIPIMVGNLEVSKEKYFGQLLSEYLKDDKVLFIISSDFCHWGSNFDYTPYDSSYGEIWESIEKMDKDGIALIEKQSCEEFAEYLNNTENTICGRHPIGVFLNALKFSKLDTTTKMLHYRQSSPVKTKKQSSVSYSSIATYI